MLFVFSSAILVFALSLSFVLIKPFSFNLSGVGSSCLSLLALSKMMVYYWGFFICNAILVQ